jgi:hypothetical protein
MLTAHPLDRFLLGQCRRSAFTNGAHKAYLRCPRRQLPEFLSLQRGYFNPAGADSQEAGANAPVYNLAGQRVSKSYRGVVVQNGKKFVNR